MPVSKAKKQDILSNLETLMKDSKSLAFVQTNKISVSEDTKIRKDLRENSSSMIKAKKTLIRLAFKNVHGVEMEDDMLPWAVSVVFSFEDPMSGMWIMSKYAKEFKKEEKIKFAAAYLEDKLVWEAEATKLASIPSREVLLSKFLGSAKSPIAALARLFDAWSKALSEKSLSTMKDLESDTPAESPKEETPVAEEAKSEEAKPE